MIDHVSDLQWDRVLAGEATFEAGAAARGHARGCAACAARLRELTAERDAFAQRPVGVVFRRPRHARWWVAGPVLAAALALVIVRAGRSAAPDDPDGRAKGGGPALVLAAGPPDALVPLATGDAIHPGEHLQAGYRAARDGFGAVLSRDGAGLVTVYVPARGAAMVALPAGIERSFPASTLLDDVTGRERVVLVWCEVAQPLAPWLAQLGAGVAIAPVAGCTVRDLALDKRAAP